jgi:hypothetical protein
MVPLDAQKLEEPSGAEDLEVWFWTCRMSDVRRRRLLTIQRGIPAMSNDFPGIQAARVANRLQRVELDPHSP